MKILVTGAGGLIGSEAVENYCNRGKNVYGIENNQREIFFGPKGFPSYFIERLVAVFRIRIGSGFNQVCGSGSGFGSGSGSRRGKIGLKLKKIKKFRALKNNLNV
jgi:hypothetical protein